MELLLGNVSPASIEPPASGKGKGKRLHHDLPPGVHYLVTHVAFGAGTNIATAFESLTQVWQAQSDAPPAWVSSDDDELAEMAHSYFTSGANDGHHVDVYPWGDTPRP